MDVTFRPAQLVLLAAFAWSPVPLLAQGPSSSPEKGSVIFIHPDGSGIAAWGAARLTTVGPDGTLNWDRLERIGVYRGGPVALLHIRVFFGSLAHEITHVHAAVPNGGRCQEVV